MNHVWESSERMPTLDEINNPQAWIARVKSGGPPAKLRLV
jgi:uncharacterized protein (DUF2342 family)